jgi:hypothetical protein
MTGAGRDVKPLIPQINRLLFVITPGANGSALAAHYLKGKATNVLTAITVLAKWAWLYSVIHRCHQKRISCAVRRACWISGRYAIQHSSAAKVAPNNRQTALTGLVAKCFMG